MSEPDFLRYMKIFVALAFLGLTFVLANMMWDKVQTYVKTK